MHIKDLLPRIVLISIDHNIYDVNCQKKLNFSDRPPFWPLATLFVKAIMVANLSRPSKGHVSISLIRPFLLFQIALLLAIFALASGDLVRQGRRGRRLGGRRQRQGRQEAEESAAEIQGGVDFTDCTNDEETGLCCIEKEETIKTIQKVRSKIKKTKSKRLTII